MITMYDDLHYTICLVCKPGSDLGIPREILKAEFGLIEGYTKSEVNGRALVMPNPSNPEWDFIYRIVFKPNHKLGPIIDFKYKDGVSEEIFKRDPRKEAIKRAEQLVDVVDVIDWLGKRLCLSFLKL